MFKVSFTTVYVLKEKLPPPLVAMFVRYHHDLTNLVRVTRKTISTLYR